MNINQAIKNTKTHIPNTEIQNYEDEYNLQIKTDTPINIAITYTNCCELLRYLNDTHQIPLIIQALEQHKQLETITNQYQQQEILTTPIKLKITNYINNHYNDIMTIIRYIKRIKIEEQTNQLLK